jgi:hypothetical protein
MFGRTSQKRERRFSSVEDEFDYKLIYSISFAVFFAAAVGSSLTQWSGLGRNDSKQKGKSILERARSDASSAVAFSFMR